MLHAQADFQAPPNVVNPIQDAMQRLLPAVEYRRCVSGPDFDAVARLRFDAYRSSGMIGERPDGMLRDANDDLPNSFTYGVWLDGTLAGTVRFHHLSPNSPRSPSMDMFPEVLGPRLEAGDSFIDPSRFAADPEMAGKVKALPHLILRTVVAATDHFGATSCLSLVQGNHGAFYRRMFGSTLLAGPKLIPPLTISAYLYEGNTDDNRQRVIRKFPFFQTSRREAAEILAVDFG